MSLWPQFGYWCVIWRVLQVKKPDWGQTQLKHGKDEEGGEEEGEEGEEEEEEEEEEE